MTTTSEKKLVKIEKGKISIGHEKFMSQYISCAKRSCMATLKISAMNKIFREIVKADALFL